MRKRKYMQMPQTEKLNAGAVLRKIYKRAKGVRALLFVPRTENEVSFADGKKRNEKTGLASQPGFGLVEIVVVSAIVSLSFFGFLQAEIGAIRLLRNEKDDLSATLLAQESLEAVRSVRDESWSANISWVPSNVPYYPSIQSGEWILATTSPGLIDGKFNRYIVFGDVYRNSQDQIAPSGTFDPNTRKVTAYATTTAKQIILTTYITNFENYLTRPQEVKTIYFEGATTDSNLASFPSNNVGDGDPAQGFTTLSAAIKVSKVELYLRRATASPSIIYAELRQTPTGPVLGATNTIDSSTIPDSGLSWVEFQFNNPVSLAASTKYYIRLRSIPSSTDALSGSVGTVDWGYLQTPSSPYAGGEARRYIGQLSNPSYTGQSLDQYDYGFKVYALQ